MGQGWPPCCTPTTSAAGRLRGQHLGHHCGELLAPSEPFEAHREAVTLTLATYGVEVLIRHRELGRP
jgi:hypothetical protein